MKKTFIIIIIILVIALGFIFLTGGQNKLEAPIITDNEAVVSDTNTIDNEIVPVVETTTGEIKEFTITGQKFSFSPNVMTVKEGDRVKITFKNVDGFHDFKIDEFNVASKQTNSPSEEVLEFTADKVGSFEYYCSVGNHRAMGMWGTLTVE